MSGPPRSPSDAPDALVDCSIRSPPRTSPLGAALLAAVALATVAACALVYFVTRPAARKSDDLPVLRGTPEEVVVYAD